MFGCFEGFGGGGHAGRDVSIGGLQGEAICGGREVVERLHWVSGHVKALRGSFVSMAQAEVHLNKYTDVILRVSFALKAFSHLNARIQAHNAEPRPRTQRSS